MRYPTKPVTFFRHDSIGENGRVNLSARFLGIPEAIKMGVAYQEDFYFFAYQRNGVVLRYKSRDFFDKKNQKWSPISQCDEKEFIYPLFNQQDFEDKSYLIITEGEFDAVAAATCGYVNSTSIPHGASSAKKSISENLDYILQFDIIYIAFDDDEPGNKAALEVQSLIPINKYRRLKTNYKDINEWLINNDKEDFNNFIINAERVIVNGFVHINDLPKDYNKALDLGVSTGWASLDKILIGMRQGEVTVVSADTGSGKTSFTCHLAYNLLTQGKKLWINSFEMNTKVIYRKFLTKFLQKKIRWEEISHSDSSASQIFFSQHGLYFNPLQNVVTIASLKKNIEIGKYCYGIDFVVLDHLDYIQYNPKNPNLYEDIKDVMRGLHLIATEYQVSIILIVHPTQAAGHDGKEITYSQLKGGASIKQFADNVIILSRLDIHDVFKKNKITLKVWKNRFVGNSGVAELLYDYQTDSYKEINIKPPVNYKED
jgi:twinkle protein